MTDAQWLATAAIVDHDRPKKEHPPYGVQYPVGPGASVRILLYDEAGDIKNGVVVASDGTTTWATPHPRRAESGTE